MLSITVTVVKLCDDVSVDNDDADDGGDIDVAAILSSVSDDASKVSNLQRVMTYCQQYLPSTVCHLSLSDLLYCTSDMRQNIVAFVVDLFDSLETIAASASAGSGGSGAGSVMSGESVCHC